MRGAVGEQGRARARRPGRGAAARAARAGLAVDRVGDNVVVRSELGRDRRVVLGGHLDTVPANGNATPRRDGDTLHGLGAADMKGGARDHARRSPRRSRRAADAARFDATFVFYVGEEIAEEWNGLRDLFARAPELVAGDLAILLEPTDGWVEAGLPGHAAPARRPTAAPVRTRPGRGWARTPSTGWPARSVASPHADPGPVDVDGLEYRQALQAVRIEGGIANNVVPDECSHRREPAVRAERDARSRPRPRRARWWPTPTRSRSSTRRSRRRPTSGTRSWPSWSARSISGCARSSGWTDVARFAAHGVPALNFGPGDPTIAHTAGEFVTRESLDGCHAVLGRFLGVA